MKGTAMLVVSFGTSFRDTLEKNIAALERRLMIEFPEYDHFRAFTSGMIRKKIKERDNITVDSTEEALHRLLEAGYEDLIVVSTHVIPGEEYEDVLDAVCKFADKFKSISVSEPLLSAAEDYEKVIKGISLRFPELKINESIVLMGHGSAHSADGCYERIQALFDKKMLPYYMATVEGSITLESIMQRLKESGTDTIFLYPFMLVAGDHAINDMAGNEEDSFKSILEKQGFRVLIVMEGLGENNAITDIYLQHAKDAIGKKVCR